MTKWTEASSLVTQPGKEQQGCWVTVFIAQPYKNVCLIAATQFPTRPVWSKTARKLVSALREMTQPLNCRRAVVETSAEQKAAALTDYEKQPLMPKLTEGERRWRQESHEAVVSTVQS